MELRARFAFCTTDIKSLVGSAKAFSISVTAAFTLLMAEFAFGNPTAFARYSPISAESFASFLRFSSCCLVEISEDTNVAAVAPTRLVMPPFSSSGPLSNLASLNSDIGDKLDNPFLPNISSD